MNLDRKTLNQFIEVATKKLTGEWLILGGTVLPLLGANIRSTVDIDFVGLGKKEREQQLEVMQIAEDLGLPIETINSAAAFFVDRVLKDKMELVPLVKNKRVTIYRPSTLLYFKLKLPRFSETDLADCQEWLRFFANTLDAKTVKNLLDLIAKEAGKTEISPEKHDRFMALEQSLRHKS